MFNVRESIVKILKLPVWLQFLTRASALSSCCEERNEGCWIVQRTDSFAGFP